MASILADIVLATLNARYIHSSFGLRYLQANLGELQSRSRILEFEASRSPLEIVEALLEERPKILGLGVYIWNAMQSQLVVAMLKKVCPQLQVVLGGPEVSHETEAQEIVTLADYVIQGEADLAFGDLCQCLLSGQEAAQKIIAAPLPDLGQLQLPYELYTAEDVQHRVVYVEASRGCPFKCQFCLSALDKSVRSFDLDDLLQALAKLFDRGVRHFKFVDRTFNLNIDSCLTILQFFLDRYEPGMLVHFEMIPDRLPSALHDILQRFPAGVLQFEVGIQTFNPQVGERIQRRQDLQKLSDNLAFLRSKTGVHVHADLIVGLPGETLHSFAAGFDRLWRLRPQEIQVGILKRLRGAPISQHDQEFGMLYSETAPYEILANSTLDFAQVQALRRFSRYFDLLVNSGNYQNVLPMLLVEPSAFTSFSHCCAFLYAEFGRAHSISMANLAAAVFAYLTGPLALPQDEVGQAMAADFRRCRRNNPPACIAPYFKAMGGRLPPLPTGEQRWRQAQHGDQVTQ